MSRATKKLITVIIATYQRPEHLKLTLGSIGACTMNDAFDYEVIVADNNSRDNTKQVVEQLMPSFNGRLKYVFEAKQGKSFALNAAIQLAQGDCIAMTDDDCMVHKDWLLKIYQTFSEKNVDMLCGKVKPIFNDEIPKWLDVNNIFFHGPIVSFNLGEKYFDNSQKSILATGANLIVSKASLAKFGGFQKEKRSQDTEISYRWQQLGAVIGYSPDVLVYHTTSLSRLNKKYFRRWHFLSGKNSVEIFKENYQKEGRRFMGVPLWVYHRLLDSILIYIKGVFTPKNNFANELGIHFHLGVIAGLRHYKFKFERFII